MSHARSSTIPVFLRRDTAMSWRQESGLVALSVGAITVAVGIAVSAFLPAPATSAVLLLCLSLIASLVLQQVAGFSLVHIPLIIVPGVISVGAVLYPELEDTAAVSADLPVDAVSMEVAIRATSVLVLAMFSGALMAAWFRRDRGRSTDAGPMPQVHIRPGVLMVVGILTIALVVIGKGSALLYTETYLGYNGPTLINQVGVGMLPVGLLALSVLATGQRSHQFVGWLGVVAIAWLMFVTGTRQLALVPAALIVGGAIHARGLRQVGGLRLAFAGAATLILAQLPLVLRSNPYGSGWFPLVHRLQDPGILLLAVRPDSVFGNVLFATPLTAATASRPMPDGSLGASVTPLIGSLVNWPVLSQTLRINRFTPYNGLGELAAHGTFSVVMFGFVLGAVLVLAQQQLRRLPGRTQTVALVIEGALVGLFSVTILQYNLRSATRLIWYLVALGLLLALASAITRMRESNGHDPGASGTARHEEDRSDVRRR